MHYNVYFRVLNRSLFDKNSKFILAVLCHNVNEDGLLYCSYSKLAKLTGLNTRTLTRNIDELEQSGELVAIVRGISENKPTIYFMPIGMKPALVCYILQSYFDLSPQQAAQETRAIFAKQQQRWQSPEGKEIAARLGLQYPDKFETDPRFDCSDTALKNLTADEKLYIDKRKTDTFEKDGVFRQIDPRNKTRYRVLLIGKNRPPAKTPPPAKPTTTNQTRSDRSASRSQIDDQIDDPDLRSTDQRSQIKDRPPTIGTMPIVEDLTIDPMPTDYRHQFYQLWTFCKQTIDILHKITPSEISLSDLEQSIYENGTQFAFKSLKEKDLKEFKNTHVQKCEKAETAVAQLDCVCDPPKIVKEEKKQEPSPLKAFTQQLLAHSTDLTGPMKFNAKQEAEESIQWLYEKGYTAQECMEVFNTVLKQSIAGKADKHWRKGSATWNAVTKEVLRLSKTKGSRVAVPSTTAFTTPVTTQTDATPQSNISAETLAEMKRETQRAQAFEQLCEQQYAQLSAEKRAALVLSKAEEMLTTYRDKFKGWSTEEVEEKAIYEVKKGLAKAAQARMANAALA